MTKTRQAKLKKEIKSFFDAMHAEGINFSAAFIFPGSGKHDGAEFMSAKDDHHVLDLINNQLQTWTALNHKAAKK